MKAITEEIKAGFGAARPSGPPGRGRADKVDPKAFDEASDKIYTNKASESIMSATVTHLVWCVSVMTHATGVCFPQIGSEVLDVT